MLGEGFLHLGSTTKIEKKALSLLALKLLNCWIFGVWFIFCYFCRKYIDYEFTLTPELLRKIKTYNTKLASYDIYCGKIRKNTNIAEYNSNLFRSGNGTNDSSIAACKTIGNGVIKGKLGTPGVNNQ